MKRFLIMFVIVATLVLVPKRGFSGIGDAAIVGLLGSIETLNKIGNVDISNILGGIDKLKEQAQNIIAVTSEIADFYEESQELLEVGENCINIYDEYTQGVLFVAKNEVFLSDEEVKTFIYLLDNAAFGLTTTDKLRTKGVKRVADGALTNLPQLFKWYRQGQNSGIGEMVKTMEDTRLKVRKCLMETRTVNHYIQASVYKIKYEMGIYDINDFKESVFRKHMSRKNARGL